MRHFYELLVEMTKRELVARYKNTLLGFLWVILNPLLQMFVIGFVFRFFVKETVPNYYLFLLVGLLVWDFFSASLAKATQSIINERSLIKKANFPREVIPLSIICSNLVHLLIAVMVLIVPVLFLGFISIYNFQSLLSAILLLLAFTTGLSLLTSALNVRYRDINFLVQAILIIWFYASPVVYPLSIIPYNLIWIWRLNPMTSILQLFQNALISSPGPGLAMLLSNTAVIAVISVAGLKFFRIQSKNFDDWV